VPWTTVGAQERLGLALPSAFGGTPEGTRGGRDVRPSSRGRRASRTIRGVSLPNVRALSREVEWRLAADDDEAHRRGGMTVQPLPAPVTWTWPAEPASVAAARHRVMDYLCACSTLDPPLNDVCLVASELVTNAVVHAYVDQDHGEVRVVLDFTEQHLRLIVEDDGGGLMPRSDSPGLGLGIPIVATVAEDVTTRTSPGEGTHVAVTFLREPRLL
jgi:anti-sigma regulatory factor (Ser/Thr protein kinase)